MACLLVNNEYAVLDCMSCRGTGTFIIIGEKAPPKNDVCGVCKGTGLVRVPIEDIPILHLGEPENVQFEEIEDK